MKFQIKALYDRSPNMTHCPFCERVGLGLALAALIGVILASGHVLQWIMEGRAP